MPGPAGQRYDVLLLDYKLPGQSALDLLKELQSRGVDLPVVVVTGRGDEEIAVQALRLGASDYLVKNPGYLHQVPSVLENAFHRKQLARERAALARAVEERRRAEAALQRSEVMAAIGAVVAGVAHEVRNPLFGISSIADAMEARFGTQAAHAEYLAHLRREIDRLAALMCDLLEYGRPGDSARAPGAVGELLSDVVAACRTMAAQSGVRLALAGAAAASLAAAAGGAGPAALGERTPPGLVAEAGGAAEFEEAAGRGALPQVPPSVAAAGVGGAPPIVAMDRERLRRVFLNLVQNAVQCTPAGGAVTVRARALRGDGEGWVECTVEDDGPGFAVEDFPRVFEPFFSRRRGGTGLGLSIVQRIVEEHGGSVAAANREQGGAVLTVRLPVAAAPAPAR